MAQGGRVLRAVWRWGLLLALFGGLLPARAFAQTPVLPQYQVQPGDTLPALAARSGATVPELQQLNNLRDPRAIYPGQWLTLPRPAAPLWTLHRVAWDDTWLTLARRAGLSWEAAVRHNGVLQPGALTLGQTLHLPPLAEARPLESVPLTLTHLSLAAVSGVSTWQMRRLNPLPRYSESLVLLPAVVPADLIAALELSPQPTPRGQTATLAFTTTTPATCQIAYLNRVEPCWGVGFRHTALVGIPALQPPGVYEIEVRLQSEGRQETYRLPLHVAAGRYDYERLDLPSDRQALLDPTLSQHERVKVAALVPLRSAERFWEYPFARPVEASVTSYYGSRRSYGYGFTSYHAGADFRAQTGTPVHSPATGVVVLAEPLVVRGHAIILDHGWGVVTGYWHLSRIDAVVGQRVARGEVIGAIGNTGLSTGPHLHWELWVNGVAVDPLPWLTDFASGLLLAHPED